MGYRSSGRIVIPIGANNPIDPADGETRYFGNLLTLSCTITDGVRNVYVPQQGWIRGVHFIIQSATAAGTNENIVASLRKNNTTDFTIATVGTAATIREFRNLNMNVSMVAGDYFEIKIVFPTWATNPQGMYFNGIVYFDID